MAEHLLKRFDEELNNLRHLLLQMGTLVQHQIEYAVDSVLESNSDYAKQVLKYERKIDKLDLKIRKQGLKIFALHQPVAMDLRLVLSSVSINSVMELIGDIASNIAQVVIDLKVLPGVVKKTKFKKIGRTIKFISNDLIKAFMDMDDKLANEILKKDDEVENLFKENFKMIVKLMNSDNKLINSCSYLIEINKNLHSISHQIRSIAKELIFLLDTNPTRTSNLPTRTSNLPTRTSNLQQQ